MRLEVDEFIRRFGLHVLPKGFVRIRHYGLLANRARQKKIARCRALLLAPEASKPVEQTLPEKLLRLTGVDIQQCPACQQGRMVIVDKIDRLPQRLVHPMRVEIYDSS
jgi:hypothetical protein